MQLNIKDPIKITNHVYAVNRKYDQSQIVLIYNPNPRLYS